MNRHFILKNTPMQAKTKNTLIFIILFLLTLRVFWWLNLTCSAICIPPLHDAFGWTEQIFFVTILFYFLWRVWRKKSTLSNTVKGVATIVLLGCAGILFFSFQLQGFFTRIEYIKISSPHTTYYIEKFPSLDGGFTYQLSARSGYFFMKKLADTFRIYPWEHDMASQKTAIHFYNIKNRNDRTPMFDYRPATNELLPLNTLEKKQ